MTFEFWNICVLTVLGLCCWVTEPGQFASRHCWGPEAGAVWTRLPTQNQTCRCRLLSWPMCWVCLSSITVATSCPSASALREMPSEPPKEVQGGCGCIPDVPGSVPVVHWTLCLFFFQWKDQSMFHSKSFERARSQVIYSAAAQHVSAPEWPCQFCNSREDCLNQSPESRKC